MPAPAPLYLDLPHNPQQLLPASIRHSQLWDRKLKAAAAALIDDPAAWLPLYHLWDLRTAKGATGLLFRSWPHDWQVRPLAAGFGSAPKWAHFWLLKWTLEAPKVQMGTCSTCPAQPSTAHRRWSA